jgi:hypothetical protein
LGIGSFCSGIASCNWKLPVSIPVCRAFIPGAIAANGISSSSFAERLLVSDAFVYHPCISTF